MGLLKSEYVAKYGNHEILLVEKGGTLTISFCLKIDGDIVDSCKSTPLVVVGSYSLHGLIQENGVDKPVKVIVNGLGVTVAKPELYVNGNRIPLKKIR